MKAGSKGFNPEYSEDAPTYEQVSEMAGTVLIEFGTPWCGHCQAAMPAIKEALAAHTELPHIKIYDGKGKSLGRAFKVKLWPTLVLMRDGQEIERLVRPVQATEISLLLNK
jgi:thioredoxin 1